MNAFHLGEEVLLSTSDPKGRVIPPGEKWILNIYTSFEDASADLYRPATSTPSGLWNNKDVPVGTRMTIVVEATDNEPCICQFEWYGRLRYVLLMEGYLDMIPLKQDSI